MTTNFYLHRVGNGGLKLDTATASDISGLLSGGKIDSSLLPSYVDDVLTYANLAAFPGTGTTGIIYIAEDTNISYRWSGSAYVAITINLTTPSFTSVSTSTLTSTGDIALNPSTTNTVNYCNFRVGGSSKNYLFTFKSAGSPYMECGPVIGKTGHSYFITANSGNNLKINYSAVAPESYNPASETSYFTISSTGNVNVDVGDLEISTASKGLKVKGGTNCKLGTAILVGGTCTVSNTSITNDSRIFVSVHTAAGTGYGRLSTTRIASTSFTINSHKADTTLETGDTSTIAWFIVENV